MTHIIAESPEGFDDGVRVGFSRASKTLRGITGMRVLEQREGMFIPKAYINH